ncbi:anti-sigma factor family protein [Paenibacillus bovis]|uniref:Uncharacterized protein n=1 Tax=Paenibacillus bovis TaxID=1616788 RepID=A0A172ZJE4_9BACL|nr:hypothetical protein [Paenibacillus bovis]ANF97764.1 hypothetical protein AR543_18260 [Paenibacillus bovis]
MKREVAEEWMSRYLDGDLNGEDTKALFRYMDENPDAAETFRIMTALSLRLEKLPDVTPKYSLVDAILPQLDLLDEERRTESAAEIGIMEPQKADTDELADRRRQRRSWRERLPVRTIGGIVAAGVVLGVSIANYEPKTLSEAGPQPVPYSAQQEEAQPESGSITSPPDTESSVNPPESDQPSSGSQEPSNGKDIKEPETSSNTPSASESTKTPPASKEPERNVTPQESTHTPDTREEQPPASGNRGGISSGDNGSTSNNRSQQPAANPEVSSQQDSSPADSTAKAPSADTGKTNKEAAQDKQSAAESNPESTDAPSTQSQESTTPDPDASSNNSPKADTPPADTPTLDTKSTERSLLPSTSSVNGPKQEQEWKSPGADYTVVLTTDNILRLDSIAEDNVNGRTVVSSITLKGSLISGRWSDDGKIFTYQVNENGISKTYKITIGND